MSQITIPYGILSSANLMLFNEKTLIYAKNNTIPTLILPNLLTRLKIQHIETYDAIKNI